MPSIGAQIMADLAVMPKPMPEDFSPDLWVEDGKLCCHVRYEFDGQVSGSYALGFVLSDDPTANDGRMRQLRYSLWQALEMTRLRQYDRLRASGILNSSVRLPNEKEG